MSDVIYLKTGQFSNRSFNAAQKELKKAADALNILDDHGAMSNTTYTCDGISRPIFSVDVINEASSIANLVNSLHEKLEAYSSLLQSGPDALQDADSSFKGEYTNAWQRGWYSISSGVSSVYTNTVGFWGSLFRKDGKKTGEITETKSNNKVIQDIAETASEATQSVVDESPRYVPFTEESVHDYSGGVTRGTIRYVNQHPLTVMNESPDPDTGLKQGWREEDLKKGSGSYLDHQCNWACESMAFSYLGIDQPPSSMHDNSTIKQFELALGVNDGDSATFDAVDGSATVEVHSNGWGAPFDRGYLDSLVANFEQDGGQGVHSPVMLHYSDGNNMHWILITGKNADGTYRAIGPWSNPDGINERNEFNLTIGDNGVVWGSGFNGGDGSRRVDCIGQYTRTN